MCSVIVVDRSRGRIYLRGHVLCIYIYICKADINRFKNRARKLYTCMTVYAAYELCPDSRRFSSIRIVLTAVSVWPKNLDSFDFPVGLYSFSYTNTFQPKLLPAFWLAWNSLQIPRPCLYSYHQYWKTDISSLKINYISWQPRCIKEEGEGTTESRPPPNLIYLSSVRRIVFLLLRMKIK